MGFAWQPFGWGEDVFAETERLIAENGDMIAIYFDGFVPWQEALEKRAYDPVQEAEIEKRLAVIRPHQKVLLGLSLLAGDRVSLAGNLGAEEAPRQGVWAKRTFDNPEVIEAYLNYCRDLIGRFDPDYFVYVMEIDSGLMDEADLRFQSLLGAVRQIYPVLKKEFPELPIMLEFMLENDEEMEKRARVTELLLPYSDYFAVSTYPFVMTGGDPADMPKNWFQRVREIAPNKPFAIAETNWLAEHFYHPSQGIPVPFNDKKLLIFGREAWQVAYLERLFDEAQQMDAEFVIQWTVRDLDQLQELLDQSDGPFNSNVQPFSALANDCGLFDGDGAERPALEVWRRWLRLPHDGQVALQPAAPIGSAKVGSAY